MVEHQPGDRASKERLTAAQILEQAPVIDDPRTAAEDKERWRQAYASSERGMVLSKNQPARSKAGFGFYSEGYGNDLFAPPIEFGGGYGGYYGGHQATWSPYDAFSNPARYGGGGYGGYAGREGWVYNRGGFSSIDHLRIAQCVLLYKTEGVVQSIVHLLADFAIENVDLVHPDETVHNFFQAWKTRVNLKDRLHRFVVDLLTTGNVFIWTKEAKLRATEKTAMKRAGASAMLVGDELVLTLRDDNGRVLRHKTIDVDIVDDQITMLKELDVACREHATAGKVNEVMLDKVEGGTRNDPEDPRAADRKDKNNAKIPWRYISLNPLQMEPRGSRFANEHYWVMMLSKQDMKPLSKFMSYRYYTDISTTKVNIPEIFKGKLQPASKGSPYAAELRLDEDRLSVIQDITKTDYEDWATPQIYPAHKEVLFKRMMRQAEISATETLKHAITLIKLGKVEEGFMPTEEQIERVAAALAGGSQVHHLVWDNLIEAQMAQPNLGNIFDPKKYAQVDKDIYAALGVSESVMTGSGSFANSFMSIKLLLEKLETIRCKLEDWLRVEIKKIADAMKFRRLPIIEWGLMNLRDENAERKLWLDLYDRGIVSDESILEIFGTSFDIEKARQEIEAAYKEENNKEITKSDQKFRAPRMVSRGPFNRDVVQKQQPKPKPPGKPGQGRPVKTGTPQQKKRTTKPKGMGTIKRFQDYYAFASNAIKTIHQLVTEGVVDREKVQDFRSLTKACKTEVEHTVLLTLAALDPSQDFNKDLVYDIFRGGKFEFSTENSEQIIALYNQEAAQASTKDERLNLMCNAFAAINADLLEDIDEEASRTLEEG